MKSFVSVILVTVFIKIKCSSLDQKRILVTTFNVEGIPASSLDFRQLLPLDSMQNLPDIVAVGFQELKFTATSSFTTSDYEKKLHDQLSRFNYKRQESVRLVGIQLIVYAKPSLTSKVETSWTRTGLSGLFGNKGGVGISLVVGNRRIAFINSHFYPHEGHIQYRINDYHKINNELTFKKQGRIVDHDYTIWMGDLNFRVQQYSAEEVEEAIRTNEPGSARMNEIFERDELTIVRSDGRAFNGYHESKPIFHPTYKFYPNTPTYNLKRKPAWTDRILYRVKQHEPGLNATQVSYTANFDLRPSDHRPVSSIILINA